MDCRTYDLGLRDKGQGFTGLEFEGLGCIVVWGVGVRVSGLGFRVEGL